jgi:hypothetical protein
VSAFFSGCEKIELPLSRYAQKRDKTKPSKTTEGQKKNGGKKSHFLL